MKAWLSFLSVDYPKTHSLETLLELLKAQGQSLPHGLDHVSALTPFATTFRYDDLPFTTSFSRGDSLDLARQVLAFVESKVAAGT